jgi:hypothetical protein
MIIEMNCKIGIEHPSSILGIKVFDKNGDIHLEYALTKKSDLFENKLGPILNDLGYDNKLSIDIITKIKQITETIVGVDEIKGKISEVTIIFSKKGKPTIDILIPYSNDDEVLEITKIDNYSNSMIKRIQKLGYTDNEAYEFSSKINKIQKIILN